MRNSETIPSGHRGSAMQHESVTVPRELSQVLSAMAHERKESKTAIWRRAIKLCMAMEDPKRFFELASKGLLAITTAKQSPGGIHPHQPQAGGGGMKSEEGSPAEAQRRGEMFQDFDPVMLGCAGLWVVCIEMQTTVPGIISHSLLVIVLIASSFCFNALRESNKLTTEALDGWKKAMDRSDSYKKHIDALNDYIHRLFDSASQREAEKEVE